MSLGRRAGRGASTGWVASPGRRRAASWLLAAVCAAAACWPPGRAAADDSPAVAPHSGDEAVDDPVRRLQEQAFSQRRADWGYWGAQPDVYSSWRRHSNRLIPIYTFGATLDEVAGSNSAYRSAEKIEALFGRVPEGTLNLRAEYFDQTAVHTLQQQAVRAGKRRIVLFVFDGMDWWTTWAAAIYAKGELAYRQGRGSGLVFQDYRGAVTDFGYFVTSPRNGGTRYNVDDQVVISQGDEELGGYDPRLGSPTPWQLPREPLYHLGTAPARRHAVTDSASSATSLCSGVKTYDQAINVDHRGAQVEPIARALQREGWSVGVVTSVPVSHATPACAYANNVERYDYQDLFRDLVGLPSIAHRLEPLPGVDVLLGAGWGWEAAADRNQGANFVPGNPYATAADREAIDLAQGGRYRVVTRTAGAAGGALVAEAARQAAQRGERLFGFFGVKGIAPPGTVGGHLPYRTADGRFDPLRGAVGQEIYTPADIHENPTLAELTRAALEVLATNPRGFWLMVEAGDVDWANHDNNIDNSIGAVLAGDDAVRSAIEWIEAHGGWDDTLLIVTADHGHHLVLVRPEVLAGSAPR